MMSSDSIYQYDDDYSKFLLESCDKANFKLRVKELEEELAWKNRRIAELENELNKVAIESHGLYPKWEDDLK